MKSGLVDCSSTDDDDDYRKAMTAQHVQRRHQLVSGGPGRGMNGPVRARSAGPSTDINRQLTAGTTRDDDSTAERDDDQTGLKTSSTPHDVDDTSTSADNRPASSAHGVSCRDVMSFICVNHSLQSSVYLNVSQTVGLPVC